MEIEESLVPGIGMKYSFHTERGVVSIVIKPDGSKEIYYSENGDFHVIPLTVEESQMIGVLLLELSIKFTKGKDEILLGKSRFYWTYVNSNSEESIIKIDRNALFFIRNGKIEKDLNQTARAGDIIFSGE